MLHQIHKTFKTQGNIKINQLSYSAIKIHIIKSINNFDRPYINIASNFNFTSINETIPPLQSLLQ